MDESTGEIPENPTLRPYPDEFERKRAFFAALQAAQEDAPRILKADERHNKGFAYAAETTYQRILIPILLAHHLVVELVGTGPPSDLELGTQAGGIQWMTTLEVVFRVTHSPSGHSEVYRVQGRRMNDQDKGVSQAITSASKTFFQRLLQIAEHKDASPNPVQEQQTVINARIRGGRPPQKAVGNPAKPPSPDGPTETPAQRLKLAKDDIKGKLKTLHMRVYHLEALAQTDANLPDDLEEWGLPDYEVVQEVLQKDPDRPEIAMRVMSEKFPSNEERKDKLHDLMSKVKAQDSALVDGETAILVAAAMASDWSDAVEWWIDKFNDRLQGQKEADV